MSIIFISQIDIDFRKIYPEKGDAFLKKFHEIENQLSGALEKFVKFAAVVTVLKDLSKDIRKLILT